MNDAREQRPSRSHAEPLREALERAGREERWRLLLGAPPVPPDDPASGSSPLPEPSPGALQRADAALTALHGRSTDEGPREGNLAASRPALLRWWREVEALFPRAVARRLRGEAIAHHRLESLLLEPGLLEALEPDARLIAKLIAITGRQPEGSAAAAKARIRELVDALGARLEPQLAGALGSALRHARRGPLRSTRALDLRRTVRDNLRHWDPATGRLGISRLRFHGAATHQLPFRLILAIDGSGSMEASRVHAAITAGVLSRLPTLETRVVCFDTALVELPPAPVDPLELLLSARPGGGTDLAGALGHCAGLVEDPSRTLLVLVSDLETAGAPDAFLGQLAALEARGVRCLCLLALEDSGEDGFHRDHARAVGGLGIPALAITPEHLPEVLAAAIRRDPLDHLAVD